MPAQNLKGVSQRYTAADVRRLRCLHPGHTDPCVAHSRCSALPDGHQTAPCFWLIDCILQAITLEELQSKWHLFAWAGCGSSVPSSRPTALHSGADSSVDWVCKENALHSVPAAHYTHQQIQLKAASAGDTDIHPTAAFSLMCAPHTCFCPFMIGQVQ